MPEEEAVKAPNFDSNQSELYTSSERYRIIMFAPHIGGFSSLHSVEDAMIERLMVPLQESGIEASVRILLPYFRSLRLSSCASV